MAYTAEQYQLEKATGVRRANGALALTRLRGKHYAVIDLHMAGESNRAIAEQLGYSEVWVSLVLGDKLSRAEIDKRVAHARAQLNPIYVKAIGRLDEGLDATYKDGETPNHTVRLRSVDMAFKVRGDYVAAETEKQTAEDVVAQIINLQVNVNGTPALPGPPPINGEKENG